MTGAHLSPVSVEALRWRRDEAAFAFETTAGDRSLGLRRYDVNVLVGHGGSNAPPVV